MSGFYNNSQGGVDLSLFCCSW